LRSTGENEDPRPDGDHAEPMTRGRHVWKPPPAFPLDVECFDFIERAVGFAAGRDDET
jgi:hypothetical protein